MKKKKITFYNKDNLTDEQLLSTELFMQEYSLTRAKLNAAERALRMLEEDDFDEDFDDFDDLDILDILDEDDPLPFEVDTVAESGGVAVLDNQFCFPASGRDEEYKFYYRRDVWEQLEKLNHNLHLKTPPELENCDVGDENDLDDSEFSGEGAAALEMLVNLYRELMPKEIFLEKVPARFGEAVRSIKELSKLVLAADSDAIIEVRPDHLTGSSLTVEFTAKILVFEDLPAFLHAIAPATNFEFCTLVTGELSFDILFKGVFEAAKPVSKV